MEMDNEVSGKGNSYTTHFRQYDPRVGRWLSIDPKFVVWESPYVAFRNNPLKFIDTRGDCPDDNCDDVVKSPEISDDNGSRNNNRYNHGSTRGHGGVAILAKKGEEIKSVYEGVVYSVVNNHKSDEYSGIRRKDAKGNKVKKSPTTGLGNTVVIKSTFESDYIYQTEGGKEYVVKKGETVHIKYSHLDIGYKNLEGKKVSAGTPIGKAGATGNAGFYNGVWGIKPEKRHVHIEARIGGVFGRKIDPEGFFKTKFDASGSPIVPAKQ